MFIKVEIDRGEPTNHNIIHVGIFLSFVMIIENLYEVKIVTPPYKMSKKNPGYRFLLLVTAPTLEALLSKM